MIDIDMNLKAEDLNDQLEVFWERSAQKILLINSHPHGQLPLVVTVDGVYGAAPNSNWTIGFSFGSSLIQFEATGDRGFLDIVRNLTKEHFASLFWKDYGMPTMSTHVSLNRMELEGLFEADSREKGVRDSIIHDAAVTLASFWYEMDGHYGFVRAHRYKHNRIFAPDIRAIRVLIVAHLMAYSTNQLDPELRLFDRAMRHLMTTMKFIVFYGGDRDIYDEWGRTIYEAHLSGASEVIQTSDVVFGYSGFSTWTRGQAHVLLGAAESLEMLAELPEDAYVSDVPRDLVVTVCEEGARATADHFIKHTPPDGICYWDTGAPNLFRIPDHENTPADPYNAHEPVDSSAAAIAAQGLLRLGRYFTRTGETDLGKRYRQAGLVVLKRLLESPYLNDDEAHQGLLLHIVYNRPYGWDHIREGQTIPNGESAIFGDYHLREAALLIQREIDGRPACCYFDGLIK